MHIHEFWPWAYFFVTFFVSIFSGMIGGGGGFIITPFLIAIGLTPQQAIATGKVSAVGLDTGSIIAFNGKFKASRKFTIFLIVLSALLGAVSSYFIRHIRNENLQLMMGGLILAMTPFVFIKHHKLKSHRPHYIFQGAGILALAAVILMQGVFSSGIGSLENIFLIVFFGFSALQANMLKRRISLALDAVILIGLLGSGLIYWNFGLLGALGGAVGGFIGSKIAVREGERFARYALLILMLVSGVYLLATS